MSNITTHVLDTSRGRPAAGVAVVLEERRSTGFAELGRGVTDADGRMKTLMGERRLEKGVYRLTFHVAAYFEREAIAAFYPEVSVVFAVDDPSQHYHVPLLLNPFGYSTYRGS